jgi:hypothetical protein
MFKNGYYLLELTPDVELRWQTAWEDFKAGA